VKSSTEFGELVSLSTRLLELERERSEAKDHVRLLVALQHAFASIAVTRSPDDVVAHMLRAAYDPLGFSRGIFFNIDRGRGIAPRWQFDGSDEIEASTERLQFGAGNSMLSVLRGEVPQSVGCAGELSTPLVDTRGWYVLNALTHAGGTLGLLYLDGHRARAPRDWETGLAQALSTVAAVSIANSLLFARTEELAERDPLTGLFNRRAFAAKLDAAIEDARSRAHPLTFVLIDVDDFKRINDRLGHASGDSVLKTLAQTLLHNSRAGDVVARYAGDEFVALFLNSDGERAHSLVARLSADFRARGLRCSLGAAIFPTDARDAAGLLKAADRALYETKAAGKNGYFFSS
jgi:diguanylate cyclase (GGDEF)-like protein